jgi:hypothetical protein
MKGKTGWMGARMEDGRIKGPQVGRMEGGEMRRERTEKTNERRGSRER